MSVTEALRDMMKAADDNFSKNKGDYVGDDGLLRCGTCHKRKQTRFTYMGTEKIVSCICDCYESAANKERAERNAAKRIAELRRMCFPERALEQWNFANDNGSNPALTTAMQRYVENFKRFKESGKGLLLCGNCGTGKTYAACEVANALIDQQVSVRVTNFSRILNEMQSVFDKQGYLDDLNKHALLVIDDLGIERDTAYAKEQVFNVIDSRYRTGLPMIITTNLSPNEINKTTDIESKRIYDRILERCHPITVTGASKRRQKVRDEYEQTKQELGM